MSFESKSMKQRLANLKSNVALGHLHQLMLFQTDEEFIPQSPFQCVDSKFSMNQTQVKCGIPSGDDCYRMQEKFIAIQTGVQDKKEELEASLRKTISLCKSEKANYEATISLLESQLREEQGNLAKSTSEYNINSEQSTLQSVEYKRLNKEYIREMCKCDQNIKSYWGEHCGLGKIRIELEKIKGHSEKRLVVVDCKVSDWIPGKCSVDCGGGTRTLTRSVEAEPTR